MSDEYVVNGLPLPDLLVNLIVQGKWQHPGDEVLREVIPFLKDPVNFDPVETLRRETEGNFNIADDPKLFELFHMFRGSKSSIPVELPWLDVEQATLLAVCRMAGDDVCIALDYRTSANDPRVVATELTKRGFVWREVSPTFSAFVERLGLDRSS